MAAKEYFLSVLLMINSKYGFQTLAQFKSKGSHGSKGTGKGTLLRVYVSFLWFCRMLLHVISPKVLHFWLPLYIVRMSLFLGLHV